MNQPQTQGMAIAGSIMPHSHHQRTSSSTQIITPFIDQSPQYITAIPVQPVLTAPTSFPASAAVISPLLPPPDYVHSNVVLTPAQNQIQDHLQRKHEELQKLIVKQQDELRRVSEQLFMARYGLIPPIVNVSLPFVTPMDATDTGESSRCISTSAHISQSAVYHEHSQPLTHLHHHQQQIGSSQQTQNIQQIQHQPMMHQNLMEQQLTPITYDMIQKNPMDQSLSTDQTNNDIMQYMQHQSNQMQPIIQQQHQHPQQTPQQQQQQMLNDNFELIPFEMMNQQAQILFSNGNNNNNNNNNNSSANNSAK
jgi:circadian locomoter output cycle kaput protein